MSAAFRTNHISPERNEIVLITRRFPPSLWLAAISVVIGIVLPAGSWLIAGVAPQDIALRTLAISGLGVPAFYAIYYWRTEQLGGNGLLANGTDVRGHVAWTDALKYGLRDSIQLAWAEVARAKLVPRPMVFANHRMALALSLRDGTQLGLCLPNLRPSEEQQLALALVAIADRNGVVFSTDLT